MTKQETFDTVARGLIAQGQKSIVPRTKTCRYRCNLIDGTVLKCAVGMLIPDDRYDPSIETKGIRSLLAEGEIWSLNDHDVVLLTDLQMAHDGVEEVYGRTFSQGITQALRTVATEHGLSTGVLE